MVLCNQTRKETVKSIPQYQLKTRDVIRVWHTCVFNIFNEIEGTVWIYCIIDPHGVVEGHSVIKCGGGGVKELKCSFICFEGPSHTFLTQISHEQLKANKGENGKSEDSQNHDVHHFLHWLDQSAHDGFQTWQKHSWYVSGLSLKVEQHNNKW